MAAAHHRGDGLPDLVLEVLPGDAADDGPRRVRRHRSAFSWEEVRSGRLRRGRPRPPRVRPAWWQRSCPGTCRCSSRWGSSHRPCSPGAPSYSSRRPETPLDTLLFAEVHREAGLPPGLVSILPGDRDDRTSTGEPSRGGPGLLHRVDGGGPRDRRPPCGAKPQEGEPGQLGGKSAAIVLDDADPATVAAGHPAWPA